LDLTKALTSCQIDVGFSPFVTQTFFALILKSIKVHRIVALNGSGLVSKYNLKSCKVFATSEFSAMESNLKLLLEKIGLDITDLSFRYFESVTSAVESFKSCEFDAIAVWEPHFTILKGVKIPFKDVIGDFPCCSMASNVEFYKTHGDVVERFIDRLDDAVERLKDGRVRVYASKVLAKCIGFNWKTVLKSLDSYEFVCRLKREDFKFLENYGLKFTRENIKVICADF
jgi:predicted transcriptional regulator